MENQMETIGNILPQLPPRTVRRGTEKKLPPSAPKLSAQRRTWPSGMQVDRKRIPKYRIETVAGLLAENVWPVYFYGESGRGKSFMAALIYAEWPNVIRQDIGTIDYDREPKFLKSSDVLGEIADARFRNNGVRKLRDMIQMASLVVLDDIADRAATDARRAALYDVLEWRKVQPMILTGNFGPDELLDILKDDRIVDRIQAGRQIKFSGPSMRLSGLPIIEV